MWVVGISIYNQRHSFTDVCTIYKPYKPRNTNDELKLCQIGNAYKRKVFRIVLDLLPFLTSYERCGVVIELVLGPEGEAFL